MTATNIFYNFVGFVYSPPLLYWDRARLLQSMVVTDILLFYG